MTILDVLLHDELRQDFIKECENLLLFDAFYDEAIGRLETIAHEAQTDQVLSLGSAEKLIDGCCVCGWADAQKFRERCGRAGSFEKSAI